MKGLYWLILGLCVWFIPYIILQSIETPQNPDDSTSEILFNVPQEIIIIHLAIAVAVMIKAVIQIRKERKETKIKDSTTNKRKSKKK